jgi:catechol 2,3-dioxygenase-like lactoylglutathione lyase family enzyme
MTHAKAITALLNVESVERSAQFYRDVLGLEVVDSWTDQGRVRWARVRAEGVSLMLNERERGEGGESRRARPGHSDVVLYVSVDDVASLHPRLVASGYAPGAINEESYGLRQFALRDPDGYELAITSPSAK